MIDFKLENWVNDETITIDENATSFNYGMYRISNKYIEQKDPELKEMIGDSWKIEVDGEIEEGVCISKVGNSFEAIKWCLETQGEIEISRGGETPLIAGIKLMSCLL